MIVGLVVGKVAWSLNVKSTHNLLDSGVWLSRVKNRAINTLSSVGSPQMREPTVFLNATVFWKLVALT